MASKIIELFFLLNPVQRRNFIVLQLLVILMATFELIGIASIGPFMLLLSDTTIIEGNNLLATTYQKSGLDNYQEFIFYVGVAVFLILLIGTIISMYTIWVLSLFGERLGVTIGNRLFEYYLHKPWLYHASENSAILTKNMIAETDRVRNGIITPFMQLNAKLFTAVFISTALLIYDPYVAVSALIIFACSYFLIYRAVRLRLSLNSRNISLSLTERFKVMSEGFGGIKDVLFLRRQNMYVDRMSKEGDVIAQNRGTIVALSQMPRYFMELVAFGGLIIFMLYLMKVYDGELGSMIPILSVYTLAGFKLLPAFQQIYSTISTMQGNMSAYDSIKQDLKDSLSLITNKFPQNRETVKDLFIDQSIVLDDIKFTYPSKSIPALHGLTITVPKNKTVGLVGPSGSGKSTIVDILLGLIHPNKGQILIDGSPLLPEDLGKWQDKLGFVPQFIFLSDASVLENVAFGLPIAEIDIKRVQHAIELSYLSELIAELPEGLNTRVGENGVQLSGGQRQRIGIARALYRNAEILILDEATSSLDSITETMVMDAIHDYSDLKTIIIIAHRLTTVQKCDVLYLINNGMVVDTGNYDYLIRNNQEFIKMANILK